MMAQTLHSPVARTLSILPVALFTTLSILYLMQQLIHNHYSDFSEPATQQNIMEFINTDPGEIKNVYEDLEKPVKPQPPQVQPAMPTPEFVEPNFSESNQAHFVTEIPQVKVVLPTAGSGQAMPFIKVQPAYPTSAASRGIEGYVDVVFDVATSGATENIRIVNAYPSSVFNSSVIQAIKRWKYKPKMVDDMPVKSYDIRERITFELSKG